MKIEEIAQDQPIMWMPIGASGTGKSTYLQKLRRDNPTRDIKSFSFDALRHEWYDRDDYNVAWNKASADPDFNRRAFGRFYKMVKSHNDIYVDNTNLTVRSRSRFVECAKRNGYRVIAIEMPVDLDVILKRQYTRPDKTIKQDVVKQQYERLQSPAPGEFDHVIVSNHNNE